MEKIITIKIKPLLTWKEIDGKLYGFNEKEYPVFQIEKHSLWRLLCYRKEAGQFNKLKNAKACAELLYAG